MNINDNVYIAEGARLVGEGIIIGDSSSVWFNTVIRCDEGNTITIGERTNIQDLCMIHTATGYSVKMGDGVTVGHKCIIHGCSIGNNTLIGMGSVIMNGAEIGNNCIIGAGSLVTEGKIIPDGMVAFGSPAKVIKKVTEDQINDIANSADFYVNDSKEMMKL